MFLRLYVLCTSLVALTLYGIDTAAAGETYVTFAELLDTVKQLSERIEQLEVINEERDSEIDKLTAEIAALKDECGAGEVSGGIRRRRSADGVEAVAFYAAVKGYAIPNLWPFQNIVFDQVFSNVGDGYNAELGWFVTPVNGTYVISVTVAAELTSTNATEYYSYVTAAGKYVARIVGHNREQSSQTVILDLSEGDVVYVQNSLYPYSVLGSLYTTISGFLLQT